MVVRCTTTPRAPVEITLPLTVSAAFSVGLFWLGSSAQAKADASQPSNSDAPLPTLMFPSTVRPEVPEPEWFLANAATNDAPGSTVTEPVTTTWPALTAHTPVTVTAA